MAAQNATVIPFKIHDVGFRGQAPLSDIQDLDALIFRLQAVRQEAGKNLPLNVSVLQETPGNPFGMFYEDRTISPDILIVKTDVGEFVELYL